MTVLKLSLLNRDTSCYLKCCLLLIISEVAFSAFIMETWVLWVSSILGARDLLKVCALSYGETEMEHSHRMNCFGISEAVFYVIGLASWTELGLTDKNHHDPSSLWVESKNETLNTLLTSQKGSYSSQWCLTFLTGYV